VRSAFEEGERKWGKDKSGIYGAISSVSGKILKTPERPKNEVVRKVSQKFSKIIYIIKRFLVESVFRNSISFSR